jgi:hypothetical protein
MKLLKYILFCSFSILLFSCEDSFFNSIVEIEIPEHQSNIAVSAHLNTLDSLSYVHVTHTLGVLDSVNAKPISNAKVELYRDGQKVQDYQYTVIHEGVDQNGNKLVQDVYVSKKRVEFVPDANYELRVSTPEFGEVMATQQLTEAVPIIEASFEKDGAVDEDGDRGDEISIKFQDQLGVKNYYSISVFGFYEIATPDTVFEYARHFYISPSDIIADHGLGGNLLVSDATIEGKEYELKFVSFDDVQGIKRIEVTLYNTTEDRYLYERSVLNYNDNEENPFAEPVIIHENIAQGNGIFTLSNASVYSIEF